MSLLSNSAAVIRDYDNKHYLHPWEAMWRTGGADRTITARAENIYVYDPNGKRLIDGPGRHVVHADRLWAAGTWRTPSPSR